MDGFDMSSPLVCEGIVGDGCGGGRIFFIKEDALMVHDPVTKEEMVLCDNLKGVQKIDKHGCHITLSLKENNLVFDLSLMSLV